MPKHLTVAVSQSHSLPTTRETLAALDSITRCAASKGASLILFPEAYLGGYPRGISFATVGGRTTQDRENFRQYFQGACDLGDLPGRGGENAWAERKLPGGKRGDGTREELERVSRETGVFVVTGIIERSGGSLYCSVVYVDPKRGCLGKRRKVMPTGSERLIWAQGEPSTLKAVTAELNGIKLTLAAAICWENYMPLLRYSLYSQNVNLYLAPTADPRDTWLPLMRTVACEGRAVVLSANQCLQRKHQPDWIQRACGTMKFTENQTNTDGTMSKSRGCSITKTADNHEVAWPSPALKCNKNNPVDSAIDDTDDIEASNLLQHSTASQNEGKTIIDRRSSQRANTKDINGLANKTTFSTQVDNDTANEWISRGGSCVISPLGDVLEGPMWEVSDGLIVTTVDFDDCDRGKLDLDVAGHYSRSDAFHLNVEGLALMPPA